MAVNVFGLPITNATLEGLPEYLGKEIRRTDRASVALNRKNIDGKDVNARTYVENLKAQWGNGVSTKCLVYNATGDTVMYITKQDWYGHIGPAPYPVRIANGQWGAFLHVKTSGAATGSSAAVVYRGMNEVGADCDWMLSWSNPWNRWGWDNTAYTEIRNRGHYEQPNQWNNISVVLYASGKFSQDKWNGCLSDVITGSGTTVVFEATLTLENA